MQERRVALFTGALIEIETLKEALDAVEVALFTGALIEIRVVD